MLIDNSILKYYLRNVMFITGTAYAGKSTMVAMLAEKYGLIQCGENYHSRVADEIIVPKRQPNLCYFQTMKDWQEFVNRTPEEYEQWIQGCSKEAAEFEVAELIHISQSRKVIADTNIPLDLLHEIADYHQVAVMLSPQEMSVEKFFDRDDPEKIFIREQIMQSKFPQKTMKNFKACLAKVNSKENYDNYAKSGFFTLVRNDADKDTKEEMLKMLSSHFGLGFVIKQCDINSTAARTLIKELSDELQAITGSSGRASFQDADMDNPRSLFVIALEADKAVGCGAFRELSDDTAEIKRMYTRRKSVGIGGKILSYLEEQAKELGYRRIVLETRKCNEKAVSFYLNHGYRVIQNYGKYVDMPEAVCFEKLMVE